VAEADQQNPSGSSFITMRDEDYVARLIQRAKDCQIARPLCITL